MIFDDCGTGFQGYVPLTKIGVEQLKKHEEKILKEGCLY